MRRLISRWETVNGAEETVTEMWNGASHWTQRVGDETTTKKNHEVTGVAVNGLRAARTSGTSGEKKKNNYRKLRCNSPSGQLANSNMDINDVASLKTRRNTFIWAMWVEITLCLLLPGNDSFSALTSGRVPDVMEVSAWMHISIICLRAWLVIVCDLALFVYLLKDYVAVWHPELLKGVL